MQYPGRAGPITHNAAPFSPEMVAGSHPDQPRLFLAPRIPLPLSQTTHTPAAFSPEMVAGWHPDTNRLFLAPKIRPPFFDPTLPGAPFSIEMVAGNLPLRARQPRPEPSTYVPPIDVPVFSIEMVQGWHPDTPRLFLGPRIPLPLAQTTPVPAPLSVEMTTGWHPDTPRVFLAPKIPLPTVPPDVIAFLLEFIGYHPDSPRLFLGPRIGLPLSQTSPVDAPDTSSMWAGYRPDTARLFRALQPSLTAWILDDLGLPLPAPPPPVNLIAPAGRPARKKKIKTIVWHGAERPIEYWPIPWSTALREWERPIDAPLQQTTPAPESTATLEKVVPSHAKFAPQSVAEVLSRQRTPAAAAQLAALRRIGEEAARAIWTRRRLEAERERQLQNDDDEILLLLGMIEDDL